MTPTIKLTVTNGSMKGKEYAFHEPKECYVGRAADCDIQLPDDAENMDVSRHHCVFNIDPPHVWVSDLFSRNGTFVNNLKIASSPGVDLVPLSDGDEVRMGHLALQIHKVGVEVAREAVLRGEW